VARSCARTSASSRQVRQVHPRFATPPTPTFLGRHKLDRAWIPGPSSLSRSGRLAANPGRGMGVVMGRAGDADLGAVQHSNAIGLAVSSSHIQSNNQLSEVSSSHIPKQEAILTVDSWHTEPGSLAFDQFQAFGGNQIMTIGILLWVCAGVVCFAMMQTIFKLLLKNTNSKY
jgi:hypothetical protein